MAEKAKAATKSEVLAALSEKTELPKKEIGKVMEALHEYIAAQMGKKGPGLFVLPGLLKIKKVLKPKTEARQGRNPRTGEPMTFKAKPARTVVKVLALKNLKEMVK